MQEFIYLDNAASMQAEPEMIKRLSQYSLEYFPNPEAEHAAGRDCLKELNDAAERAVTALTDSNDYKIFWTASATEAMNIIFSCRRVIGDQALISRSEHPAMSEPLKLAEIDLLKLNIRRDGTFDLDDLTEKLNPDIKSVFLHHIQNETGAIQNLVAVREIMNKKAPAALLIIDTVQSVGKINIPWHEAGINIAFIGGHKLGIPSGGAIIYRMLENGQQKDLEIHFEQLRSGRHSIGRVDPPIALTLTDAIVNAKKHQLRRFDFISHLNFLLRKKLEESDIDVSFLITPDVASPYILTLLLPPYQGQVLVRMLSAKGVMVSAGSACEAASKEVSAALLAMGVSKEHARCVLRVSFGFRSVESDVNSFIASLHEVLNDY